MRPITVLRLLVVALITFLLSGTQVFAAQVSVPLSDGITVIGTGHASAAADSTMLYITLGSENYGPPMAPSPGATPGAEERQQAQSVVDALVDAGIPEGDITVVTAPFLGNAFSGPYGPTTALVQVRLDSPTSERLTDVITAASVGAAEQSLMANIAMMTHTIDDCSALQEEASQAAFNDATMRATVQADILGVPLGDVVASRDSAIGPALGGSPLMGYPADDSCMSMGESMIYGPFGPQPYDMTAAPIVTVHAMTEFTFEISAAEATPAS